MMRLVKQNVLNKDLLTFFSDKKSVFVFSLMCIVLFSNLWAAEGNRLWDYDGMPVVQANERRPSVTSPHHISVSVNARAPVLPPSSCASNV